MSPATQIVQKLWNYCNVLPACRALLGAGRRDELRASLRISKIVATYQK